jgi:hypothetical protein
MPPPHTPPQHNYHSQNHRNHTTNTTTTTTIDYVIDKHWQRTE